MSETTNDIQHLIAECRRIEEFAQTNAATHFILAARFGNRAKALALVPVVIGAALGSFVIADPGIISHEAVRWLAAGAVVLAGVFSSVLTTLNPDKSRADHQFAGSRYKTLENEARRAYDIFYREESRGEFALRVRELSRRYDELGESLPMTESWAYDKARERVRSGTYRSDSPSR